MRKHPFVQAVCDGETSEGIPASEQFVEFARQMIEVQPGHRKQVSTGVSTILGL